MACGAPDSVAAATVSYNDTVATYTCISGYSMSGGNQIVCSGSTWTGSLPTCTYLTQADDIDTNVSVFNNDMPDWLLGVLAALACVFALLLLTCIICCFMYMCGCVSGPLGSGANAVHPMNGDGSSCCCCNRGRRRRRRGDDFYDSRSSSVVDMRNGHRNDQVRIAGFNYAKQKKGYPKVTNHKTHHVTRHYWQRTTWTLQLSDLCVIMCIMWPVIGGKIRILCAKRVTRLWWEYLNMLNFVSHKQFLCWCHTLKILNYCLVYDNWNRRKNQENNIERSNRHYLQWPSNNIPEYLGLNQETGIP